MKCNPKDRDQTLSPGLSPICLLYFFLWCLLFCWCAFLLCFSKSLVSANPQTDEVAACIVPVMNAYWNITVLLYQHNTCKERQIEMRWFGSSLWWFSAGLNTHVAWLVKNVSFNSSGTLFNSNLITVMWSSRVVYGGIVELGANHFQNN